MSKKMTKSKLWGIVGSTAIVSTLIATTSTVFVSKNSTKQTNLQSSTLTKSLDVRQLDSASIKSLKVGGFKSAGQTQMSVNLLQNTKFANLNLTANCNSDYPQKDFIVKKDNDNKEIILSALNNNGNDTLVIQDANTLETIKFKDLNNNQQLDAFSLSGYDIKKMLPIDGTDSFGIFLDKKGANKSFLVMMNYNFTENVIEFSSAQNYGLIDLEFACNLSGSVNSYYVYPTPKLNPNYIYKRGFSFISKTNPESTYFLETYWPFDNEKPHEHQGSDGTSTTYLGYDLSTSTLNKPANYVSYMESLFLISNNSGSPYTWVRTSILRDEQSGNYYLYTSCSSSQDGIGSYDTLNKWKLIWPKNTWTTYTNTATFNNSNITMLRPIYNPINIFDLSETSKKVMFVLRGKDSAQGGECAVGVSYDINLTGKSITAQNIQLKSFNTNGKGVNSVFWSKEGIILNVAKDEISPAVYMNQQQIVKISSNNWLQSNSLDTATSNVYDISNTISNSTQQALIDDKSIKYPLFAIVPIMQGANYTPSNPSPNFNLFVSENQSKANFPFKLENNLLKFNYNTALKSNNEVLLLPGLKNPFEKGANNETIINYAFSQNNPTFENALFNPVIGSKYSYKSGSIKYINQGNKPSNESGYVMKAVLQTNNSVSPDGLNLNNVDLGEVEIWNGNFYNNPANSYINLYKQSDLLGGVSNNYQEWSNWVSEYNSGNTNNIGFATAKTQVANFINSNIDTLVSHPTTIKPNQLTVDDISVSDVSAGINVNPEDSNSELVGQMKIEATFNNSWYENGKALPTAKKQMFILNLLLSLSDKNISSLVPKLFNQWFGDSGKIEGLTSIDTNIAKNKLAYIFNTFKNKNQLDPSLATADFSNIDVSCKKVSGGNYEISLNGIPGSAITPFSFIFDPANVKAPLGLILGISIPVALIVLVAIIVTVVLIKKRKNNLQSAA